MFRRVDPDPWPTELARRTGLALLLSWLGNWSALVIGTRGSLVGPSTPLAFEPVTWWTAGAVLGAAGVYAVVEKYTSTPDVRFLQVSIGGVILALVPTGWLVATDPEITAGRGIVLLFMYLVVVTSCVMSFTDIVTDDRHVDDTRST